MGWMDGWMDGRTHGSSSIHGVVTIAIDFRFFGFRGRGWEQSEGRD